MPELAKVKNPFNEVSVYPPILPYVGQSEAHDRLAEFVREMNQGPESVFCAVYGDWAIGKSRLAHELIAEVYGEDQGWLLKESPSKMNRLLGDVKDTGVLPLFIPYVKVLNFESFGINSSDVLGKIVSTAFLQVAEPTGLNKTQMDVIVRIQRVITTVNPDFDFSRLSLAAQDREVNYIVRANRLFKILKDNTYLSNKPVINKLMILVDEVESAGEVNPFSVQADRAVSEYPVPLRSIRDLTEAIKSESRMATYPDISFVFFNSQTVKRHTRLEPLQRRQIEVDLYKATSDDFDMLINALRSSGYPIDNLILKLARTAFFAADRNIGWFFYIMRRVHNILQEQPDLNSPSEIFQQVYKRTGKIFQPRHIEDRNIQETTKDYMRRVVYHQMPATLSELGIPLEAKASLVDYKDPFGTRFVGEVFITQIDADSLTTELLKTGRYTAEQRPKLVGEGSPPFDPAILLSRVRTFAWQNSDEWWAYEDLAEFERQLAFAYGGTLTSRTAETIHKIIHADPFRRLQPAILLAPTMSFLLRFNELWGRLASPNWLPEQQWEALLRKIDDTPAENPERLLVGIAKLLNDRVDVVERRIEANRKFIILKVDDRDLMNMNPERKIAILRAASDPRQILDHLREMKGMPVLLIFESKGAQTGWEKYLDDTHQKQMAVPVIPRIVQPDTREYEFCIRYAFRDEPDGFKPSDVTPQGRQERDEFKTYWEEDIKRWISNLDQQGYNFRPFIASVAGFGKFLKAYPHLVAGKTKEQVQSMEEGATLIQGINDVLSVSGQDTLSVLDEFGKVVFPNLFPRILSLLEQPRKLTELEKELFYVRSSRTDVSFPNTGAQVLEQVLKLLMSGGLVEFNNDDKRYGAISEQKLGRELDVAIQQLGSFEPPYSNFAEKVSKLPPSMQQLATTCGVNFDMLLSLKASQLIPEQRAVAALQMQRLKTIPADQPAFSEVASKINDVRFAAKRVINKERDTPPEIDPETLSARITEIAADKDYSLFSVEYRIKFLDYVEKSFETTRQKVLSTIEERRNVLRPGGKYQVNDDGSQFPASPMTWLLDQVEMDLKQEVDTSLPIQLKQDDKDLPLKNRIGAGAIATAIKKIQWYSNQLSDTNQEGWWTKFTHSYDQWQGALQKYRDLDSFWDDVQQYFAGTADEHRSKFISSSLEQEMQRISKQVKNFSTTIDELAEPTIQDILDEIESINNKITEIRESAMEGYTRGQDEIRELIADSDYQAVSSLASRMGKSLTIESPEQLTRVKTHLLQHSKLGEFERAVENAGIELCGHDGIFHKYLEIWRAKQAGVDGEKLKDDFGLDVLEEMHKRNMIKLRYEVDL